MSGQILITGADGYLGRRIAARLLGDTDDRLLLTVRAADRAEFARKEKALVGEIGRLGNGVTAARVEVAAADMRESEPFAAVDPAAVTGIVHAAALTTFNVERTPAHEVNVRGAERLTAFALRCPKLERLLALSTLYSAGRRTGRVTEASHDGAAAFVNFYEWSKWEAERRLVAARDLPVSVVRLATIVADDDTGVVTQQNAFHNTLKLFFYGLLSLVPGDPQTPLYLTTADFSARGVAHLLRPESGGGVYHLAPAPDEVLTLGALIDVAFDAFEADPGFQRRRLLRPEFCDIESFRDLIQASKGLQSSPMGQALASVAPFAEQLFLAKDFDNRRLRATWTEYATPPPRRLAEATCAWLVQTRWGRTVEES